MEDVPPGFRFYPTEEELVSFYLPHKLDGRNIDLNQDIQEKYAIEIKSSGSSSSQYKRVKHGEGNLEDSPLLDIGRQLVLQVMFSLPVPDTNHGAIGIKRTMVFYTGRAPNGSKTEWKMNEYKVMEEDNQLHVPSSSSNGASAPTLRKEFSLCRVYKKSKCLRAFDRRPSGNGDIMPRPAVTVPLPAALKLGTDHREDSTYPTAISHAQNIIAAAPNIYDVEVGRRNTLSSSWSSSSEASQSVQSTGSLPMVFDNGEPVPLWELDQLDYWSFEQD